eukprot:SAG11_NODE_831_length_6955_cov_5.280776_1_plen_101_part_00
MDGTTYTNPLDEAGLDLQDTSKPLDRTISEAGLDERCMELRKLGFQGVGGNEQKQSIMQKLTARGLNQTHATEIFHAFEEVDRDNNRYISRDETSSGIVF